MEFADLLRLNGIRPEDVAIALHKPARKAAKTALCTMAEEDFPAFNAYQATHPVIPEATLRSRSVLASFIPVAEGDMGLVGLFAQCGGRVVSRDDLERDEDFIRMLEKDEGRSREQALALLGHFAGRTWFDLRLMPEMEALRGRLIVRDPMARNYMRLAERTPLPVIEITRKRGFVPPMPDWDQLVLTAEDLRGLPREWEIRLSAWRGIYLIVDQSDGARYVGAAYGVDNLLGRWREHVSGETGVTRELSLRRTGNFRFSILELVAPTAEVAEVVARERTWMLRLDTIENGLNA